MTVASDLRGRSVLTLDQFSADELGYLLDLAAELKAARREGREEQHLRGRTIALLFEKDSTRTRCAFEVAAYDQGAHVTYLGPGGTHMGHKETVKDTARVLGRMYDAIEYRGADDAVVDELAAWSGVPVYNGLTDRWHPTQILADLLTLREHVGRPLAEQRIAYLGDARFNMADSYLVGGAIMGMDVRIASPQALWPAQEVSALACSRAALSGGRVTLTEDVAEAVADVDAVATDVWLSMGEPASAWAERIRMLLPYQVNAAVLALTGNPDVRFLHCLPAFHTPGTAVGRDLATRFGLDALEVTDEVFESPASVVFDEAENRLHTIKAVLVATLGR